MTRTSKERVSKTRTVSLLRHKLLSGVAVITIIFGVASWQPQSAMAGGMPVLAAVTDDILTLVILPVLKSISTQIGVFEANVHYDFLGVMKILMEQSTGQMAASRGQAGAAIKVGQAIADSNHQTSLGVVQANVVARKMVTQAGNDDLCMTVSAQQNSAVADVFANQLFKLLTENPYKFAGGFQPNCFGAVAGRTVVGFTSSGNIDCSKAAIQAEYRKLVCAVKCGDPNAGFSDDCTYKSATGGDSSLQNACHYMKTVFEPTELVTKGIKPSNLEGWKFQSAIAYCYLANGAAPSVPTGDAALTPEGQAALAARDKWDALHLPFFQLCMKNVAEHARPPSKGTPDASVFAEFVNTQNAVCANAVNVYGLDASRFAGCNVADSGTGISAAQSREIAVKIYQSSTHFSKVAGTATAAQTDLMMQSIMSQQLSMQQTAMEKKDFSDLVSAARDAGISQ